MTKFIALFSFLILSTQSFSYEKNDPYYQISEVTVQNLGTFTDFKDASVSEGLEQSGKDLIYVIDQLIAIGKKVYPIVKKGKARVGTKLGYVSVIPNLGTGEVANTMMDMENWSMPKYSRWKVTFKNYLGMTVVNFVYAVGMQYNGSLDGKGKYIKAARVYPEALEVKYGFDFNADVETVAITNMGKKEDPVAGLTLQLNFEVSNLFQTFRGSRSFHLTGDGKVKGNL